MALVVKNPPAKAGDIRDTGSIPGLERPPGGDDGNPLQYSCLENLMDRGPWIATGHRIAQSQHEGVQPLIGRNLKKNMCMCVCVCVCVCV